MTTSLHKMKPQLRSRNKQSDVEEKTTVIRRAIMAWYKHSGRTFLWRRSRATLYEKIVAESLLQRTQAGTVNSFFPAFLRRFPSWRSLAASTPDEIGSVLKPIGLWKRRADSLFALSQSMAKRRGRFPRTREEIERLPGVGQYIANAVLLFSRGEPEPLLDTNMARIIERLFGPRRLVDIRYDEGLQATARLLVRGTNPAEANWAILDLAATVCKSKAPLCVQCPLRTHCRHGHSLTR
jgi:A/G-specific adenine glycosylase